MKTRGLRVTPFAPSWNGDGLGARLSACTKYPVQFRASKTDRRRFKGKIKSGSRGGLLDTPFGSLNCLADFTCTGSLCPSAEGRTPFSLFSSPQTCITQNTTLQQHKLREKINVILYRVPPFGLIVSSAPCSPLSCSLSLWGAVVC